MRGLILNRNNYLKERGTGKAFGFIIGLASILFILIIASSFFPKDYTHSEGNDILSNNTDVVVEENENKSVKPQIIRNGTTEKYLVTKVVDGDTIYVSGVETRIRLIGIDTPEIHNEPVQCYGPEATNYLTGLILGKYVGLESDAASGDMDRYERPLRYVYYNGENVNQKILLEGYGRESSYGSEYKYKDNFIKSQDYAFKNKLGLWSDNTCSGLE